jgi:hypothetical protein
MNEAEKVGTAVRRLLSVSHEDIKERVAEWRRKRGDWPTPAPTPTEAAPLVAVFDEWAPRTLIPR